MKEINLKKREILKKLVKPSFLNYSESKLTANNPQSSTDLEETCKTQFSKLLCEAKLNANYPQCSTDNTELYI